jgi:hypothetical protein
MEEVAGESVDLRAQMKVKSINGSLVTLSRIVECR